MRAVPRPIAEDHVALQVDLGQEIDRRRVQRGRNRLDRVQRNAEHAGNGPHFDKRRIDLAGVTLAAGDDNVLPQPGRARCLAGTDSFQQCANAGAAFEVAVVLDFLQNQPQPRSFGQQFPLRPFAIVERGVAQLFDVGQNPLQRTGWRCRPGTTSCTLVQESVRLPDSPLTCRSPRTGSPTTRPPPRRSTQIRVAAARRFSAGRRGRSRRRIRLPSQPGARKWEFGRNL